MLVAGVVVLGALAVPLQGLPAFPTDSTQPTDTTQRKASDLISEAFGPGREGPLLLVVDARDVAEGDRPAAFGQVAGWAAGQDLVENPRSWSPTPSATNWVSRPRPRRVRSSR